MMNVSKLKGMKKEIFILLVTLFVVIGCIGYYMMPKMETETLNYTLEERNAIAEEVEDYLVKYVVSDGFAKQVSESENLKETLAEMIRNGEIVLLNESQIEEIADYAVEEYNALMGSNLDTLTDEQIAVLEESIREDIIYTIGKEANDKKEDVEALTGGVSSIVIKNILAQLEEMNASIEKLQEELNIIKENIAIGASFTDISSSIGKLEDRLEHVKNNLTEEDKELASDIEEIEEDLKTLHVSVDETATVVVQLETTMDELTKNSLDSLTLQVGDTTEALNKIAADYQDILEKINNLQNHMNSKDTELIKIVNETSGKINDLSELIKKLQKELNDYKVTMNKIIKDVQNEQVTINKNLNNYKSTTDKSLSNLKDGQDATNKNLTTYKSNTDKSLSNLKDGQDITNKNLTDYQNNTNASITGLENGQNALNKDLTDYKDVTDADIGNIYNIIENLKLGQEADQVDLTEIKNKIQALDESVQECFTSVSSGKAALASALTDKGITTDATATFRELTDNVLKIGADANVIASAMLDGYSAYVGNSYVKGTMPVNSAAEVKLNCGESFSISSGYHTGNGRVTANTLASQTPADAVAGNLSKGKTGWVNGRLVIGTGADVTEAYNKGYADGMDQAMGNADISYTYHKHTGLSSANGGCYTVPVKHVHGDGHCVMGNKGCSCQSGNGWYFPGDHPGGDDHRVPLCRTCGHLQTFHRDGTGPCSYVLENVCTVQEGTILYYDLGCGKTEQTIESATIVFK